MINFLKLCDNCKLSNRGRNEDKGSSNKVVSLQCVDFTLKTAVACNHYTQILTYLKGSPRLYKMSFYNTCFI